VEWIEHVRMAMSFFAAYITYQAIQSVTTKTNQTPSWKEESNHLIKTIWPSNKDILEEMTRPK